MNIVVLGSGAGALSSAADLARAGRDPLLADLPAFAANLAPIRERGGVTMKLGWDEPRVVPVRVAEELSAAVREAEVLILAVPCFGHEPFMEVLAPLVRDGQSLLFFGEGSGAIVARRALARVGKQGVRVGETNTLPYSARVIGPGTVMAERKVGGVLFAGVPADSTQGLIDLVGDVWPYLSPAESVWETTLLNYNAIDHVPTVLANVGTIESRSGGMLLWGEGATPSVVRAIEALDGEILAIRRALGLKDQRRYRDLLIAQGFAPPSEAGLYEVVRSSRLMNGRFNTGPDALQVRYITEDIPYALNFIASIGDEAGVDTPLIDGLITIASVMLGRDFGAEGRTLTKLGLAGGGVDGLRRFAERGEA